MIIGFVAGVVVCVVVGLWVNLVFDVRVTSENTRATIPYGLSGQRFDKAQATLQAVGFTDVRAPRASYYLGVATRIEVVIPRAGTEVEKDSPVTLIPKTTAISKK